MHVLPFSTFWLPRVALESSSRPYGRWIGVHAVQCRAECLLQSCLLQARAANTALVRNSQLNNRHLWHNRKSITKSPQFVHLTSWEADTRNIPRAFQQPTPILLWCGEKDGQWVARLTETCLATLQHAQTPKTRLERTVPWRLFWCCSRPCEPLACEACMAVGSWRQTFLSVSTRCIKIGLQ